MIPRALARGMLCAALSSAPAHAAVPHAIANIQIGPGVEFHTFVPIEALGAALDGHSEGETERIFTAHNLREMRGAGLGALSYRLRTELANEAWHWNPDGRWSDAAHARGYWTSNDRAEQAIEVSYGYELPRRGNTLDQANNDGYSRLDDGDSASFWKSNPLLDPHFTNEPESEHIQWLIADFGRSVALAAARILWGDPFAREFRIQFWDGRGSEPSDLEPAGEWRDFPLELRHRGRSGLQELKLATRPVSTRYVRLLLEASSHTARAGSGDTRDSMGFAIRELQFGVRDAGGTFVDRVRHGRSASRQTRMLVSSTDPWHRASDRDADTEQPGLDRIFRDSLTAGGSVLLPVGVLYDTPENAAALLRFVRARGYPVSRMELGEEPDGQFVAPEDFAALFAQTARALKAVDSTLDTGGPSWQDAENAELKYWPERTGTRHSWIGRFLRSLDLQQAAADFQFFSFEWYPFAAPCPPNQDQVARAPRMLRDALAELRKHDVPRDIPWLIGEYGYSVHAARAEVGLEGALVNADLVGAGLTAGFERTYLYGYEPGRLMREPGCGSSGNLMILLADRAGQARYRMPTYYASWLLTHAWTGAPDRPHQTCPVRVTAVDPADTRTAPDVYAVKRPDGAFGVLLVNRDARRSWSVEVGETRAGVTRSLPAEPAELWQYSGAQYSWSQPGATPHPERDEPPVHRALAAPGTLLLPPYSITVMVARAAPE